MRAIRLVVASLALARRMHVVALLVIAGNVTY